MSSRAICQAKCAAKPTRPSAKTKPAPSGDARGADQNDGEAEKQREHRLGARFEQERGRFDADQRIIVAILVGIDML